MPDQPFLRDLIYLDFEKASSIFSQLHGGLVTETQTETEGIRQLRASLGLNLWVAKPEFGGEASEKTSLLESRVLHHDLFQRIEDALFELQAAVDVNDLYEGPDITLERLHENLSSASYLRAEGWATIEDYDRIKHIAGEFPALLEFIKRCAMDSLENAPEYQELRAALAEQRKEAEQIRNRDERGKAVRELKRQEKQVEEFLQGAVTADEAPAQWLIDGIRQWIDVFLPGRITLRVFPFESQPEFQVIANLKRESFVDADLGNLLFAYGTQPNVKLTVVGLVTSLPRKDAPLFNTMAEYPDDLNESSSALPDSTTATEELATGANVPPTADSESSPETEEAGFEKGFRGLFRAMDGLERFSRFSRYPKVTVYPLAVYRPVPFEGPTGGLG